MFLYIFWGVFCCVSVFYVSLWMVKIIFSKKQENDLHVFSFRVYV